jgi:predicted metal-dependent hydrolase
LGTPSILVRVDVDRTALARGVELFDAGAYWDCHEALEDAWSASDGVPRHFLGGLILLAAALHQARALASARGGRRNYAKALKHLALVPDRFAGVDVRELEARVHAALRDPSDRPRVPVPSQETM